MTRRDRQVHVESYLGQELWVIPKSNGEPLLDSWAEGEFHHAHAFRAQLKTLLLQSVLPKWPSFSSITVGPANICQAPRTARHFAAAPAHHYQTPRPPWFRSLSPLCTNPQTAGLMETFPKRFSVQSRRLLGKSRLQAVLSPRRLHPTVLRDSASQKGYPQLIWHSNGLENLGCLLHSG